VSIGVVTDPPRADNEVQPVVGPGNRLILVRTVLVLAAGLGAALRLWFLFHVPLNADEASVGLAAQSILHGHFNAFFPGQLYGGVEPYVTAALFGVFGQSALMINMTPLLLSLIGAVLTWRITLRLVHDRQVAALAGVLFWVGPLAAIWNSTVERGFRGITMACGLACLLFALRCLDGRHGYVDLAGLGVFLGVGWWSSPEIVYFVVPTGLALIGAIVLGPPGRRMAVWVPRVLVGLAAAAVGALPWLWVNVPGFRSLKASSFAGGQAKMNPGYGGRVETFFNHVLPMQTNLVLPAWENEVFHRPLQLVLQFGFDVIIVMAIVLCIVKGGRGLAIAAGAVALPFLLALQPGTWYWQDGRYGVFVGALLVPVLAIACDEAPLLIGRLRRQSPHRHRRGGASSPARWLMCGVVVVCAALTVVSFRQSASLFAPGTGGFFSNWGDPNGPTLQAIDRLEAGGVRTGYAEYWVAYDLDFLSKERLAITTVLGADTNRSRALNRTVEDSRQPAWLFVPPDRIPEGFQQFAGTDAIIGPASMSETAFIAKLHALGVSYRVVDAGLLRAVIPSRPVTPKQVGLP
jgi:hypothetical protein